VSSQFEFIGGAGPGPCLETGGKPRVRVFVEPFPSDSSRISLNENGVATYGQPVDVCFNSMGRGPLSVTMRGPDGFAMSGVLPALPANSSYRYGTEWTPFDWVPAIEPSWPLGAYTITARAGTLTRSHTLTLVTPHEPGIRVLGPSTDPGHNSVSGNSRAKLFLTGFQGARTVNLLAYRTTGFGPHAKFFSSANVPIPASGNSVTEIPTGPADPREGHEQTFIIITHAGGRTLLAPFSIAKEETPFPNLIVGSLPRP
jgi:hypothetical protein